MIELRTEGASVSVDPARGGRLASLMVAGRERLVGPPNAHDRSILWGCFLMAPWPGRLEDGVLRWSGRRYQLARTLGRHAIHGLVHGLSWVVVRADSVEAELRCGLGDAGWPFGGSISQRIQLEPTSLTLEAVIEAERPMPAAIGWHPWFQRGSADATLRVDSATVLRTRDLIPTGERTAVRGMTDLRSGPRIGRRKLDHTYLDAGSPAVIGWPDLELRIDFGPPIDVVVVHTRPTAFCVEPQTAWPNALAGADPRRALAEGVKALRAGDTLRSTIGFRWSTGGA